MSTSILNILYSESDYRDKFGMIFHMDCMKFMKKLIEAKAPTSIKKRHEI